MKEEALHNYDRLHYQKEELNTPDKLLYDLTGTSPEIDPDTKVGWKKVNRSISSRKNPTFITSNWLKIAASVLLVGMVGLFYIMQPALPENYLTLDSGDKVKSFKLPDGSIITINQNSRVAYFEDFTKKRNIRLQGEAYFDVKKSKIPFTISSNYGEIRVLGTTFNVKNGKNNLRVLVTSGKVKLSTSDKYIDLVKGQEGWINKNNLEIYSEPEADLNKIAWKTKTFKFENHKLSEALDVLEQYYHVKIECTDKELEKCTITGIFQDQPLKEILSSFAEVLNLKVKYKKDIILIKGEGC